LLHFTAARRQASFSRLAASSIQSTDTSSGRKAAKAVKAAKTLKEFWSFGVLSCFNSEFQWMPKHLAGQLGLWCQMGKARTWAECETKAERAVFWFYYSKTQ
jgi:hypothetical protein